MSAMTMTMFVAANDGNDVTFFFEIGRREALSDPAANIDTIRLVVEVGTLTNTSFLRMYADPMVFNVTATGMGGGTVTIDPGVGLANIKMGENFRGDPQAIFRYVGAHQLLNSGQVTIDTAGGTASTNYIQFNPTTNLANDVIRFEIEFEVAALTNSLGAPGTNEEWSVVIDRLNSVTNANFYSQLNLWTVDTDGNEDENLYGRVTNGWSASGAGRTNFRDDDLIYSSIGVTNNLTGVSNSTDPYSPNGVMAPFATSANSVCDAFGISLWGSGHANMRPKLIALMESGANLKVTVDVHWAGGASVTGRQLRLVAARDKHNYRTSVDYPGIHDAWFDGNNAYNNNFDSAAGAFGGHTFDVGAGSRRPAVGRNAETDWAVRNVPAGNSTQQITFTIPNAEIWNSATQEFLYDVLYLEKWFNITTNAPAANWIKSNNTTYIELDKWVVTAEHNSIDWSSVNGGGGGGGGSCSIGTDKIILDRKTYTIEDLAALVAGVN
jgi:hypothetical protein